MSRPLNVGEYSLEINEQHPHLVFPGDAFERLTVVGFSHKDRRNRRHYLCECVCGKRKTVQGTLLRSGNTRSCGCLSVESARKRSLGHGVASMNQVIAGYRNKAKRAGRAFEITKTQFLSISQSPCFYCGTQQANTKRSPHGTGDFSYNGLDRIDSDKGYTMNNVVPCCFTCNFAKSSISQGEFIEWIRRSYEHLAKTSMAAQWSPNLKEE